MTTPNPRTTHTAPTFLGGPESGRTRREAWEAEVVHEGVRWTMIRLEESGTPWQVVHADTGIEVGGWHGSRRKAAAWIATGAAWADLAAADLAGEEQRLSDVVSNLIGSDEEWDRRRAVRFAAQLAAVADLRVQLAGGAAS